MEAATDPTTGRFSAVALQQSWRKPLPCEPDPTFGPTLFCVGAASPEPGRAAHPASRRPASSRGDLAERLIDAEIDAMFVVSADCRLRMVNTAAARLLERGAPLAFRNDRLAPSSGEAGEFRRVVEQACSGQARDRQALVLPCDGGASCVLVERLAGGDEPLACLRLRDFEARLERNLRLACEAYSLTPAEWALAESLMRGLSPGEHAVQRGIRMPTVRSQLASIYAKAGVAGHAELVIALWLGA